MRNIRFAALVLLASIAAPALGQTPGSPDPAKVEAGSYAVEPLHTQVLFAISHLGFTTFYGAFTGASGTLSLSTTDPASSTLEVSVPISGVSTNNAKLDGELKGDKFFNAAAYPAMTFKLTKLIVGGKDTAQAMGDLTMHGVTKPITLDVHFHGGGANPMSKKATIGFDVSGEIKRSEFGMTSYLPLLGDDVKLIISAAFEKQG